MKKKRLITFLVLTLFINTFSHYSFTYAQTNQSISITKKSDTKNPIPLKVLDVLQRISKYSEASSEDIKIICSYYGIEEKALRELEEKGYDFITSVNSIVLKNKYKVNQGKIEGYIQQGLDITDLYPKDSATASINNAGSTESHMQDLNPPEELETNYEEYINPENGSYTFKQTDLVLPGENGFDLVIAPRYNSARAELFNYDNIWGDPSNDLIYTDEEYSGFLGSGWTFGYSYIEVIYNRYLKIQERERILHLSNGQSYTVILGDTEGNRLYEYPLFDMKLSLISVFGEYELTYKDGRREVFSSNGALQYIADKYNNCISFTYSFF